MKKIISIALAAVMLVGTVACTPAAAPDAASVESTVPAAAAVTSSTAPESAPESAQESTPVPQGDTLLTMPMTPENVMRGMGLDTDMLTKMAYVWGYPLVRMERVIREYTTIRANEPPTSYRAPLNQIGWATELATPASKDMPTANNDTLYMSAVVKLDEPYVFTVPDTQDRYYVVNVFNMWHELEHYIGQRTTGTKAGKFVIVPPGWNGTIPKDAGTVLNVTTDKVWLWGRLLVKSGEDMAVPLALQKGFDLRPLSELGNAGYDPKAETLEPLPDITNDPMGFLTQLSATLKENTIKTEDKALFGQFARIGLTESGFAGSKLPVGLQEQMAKSLVDAAYIPMANVASAGKVINGWTCVYDLDNFGYNYSLRSVVSGPYLGGNGAKEAIYPLRYADNEGNPLSGANKYKIVFPSDPPVGAFWSLTAYDSKNKLLMENEISRYKIGSDNDLVKNSNGTLELTIQHDAPANPQNWLPVGEGEFYLTLRMYIPDESVINGDYVLPQVEIIKP